MESLELAADTEDETTLFLELRDLPRNPDDDAGYKALLAVGEKFSKTKGFRQSFMLSLCWLITDILAVGPIRLTKSTFDISDFVFSTGFVPNTTRECEDLD